MKQFGIGLICLGILNISIAQQLDIEGDAKIRGRLDIHPLNESSSVIIGNLAAPAQPSNASFNSTVIGAEAGNRLFLGFDNLLIGNKAGSTLATGDRNSIIGTLAGSNVDSNATDNTLIGNSAGALIVGPENTIIGSFAGQFNTSATGQNCFFGNNSGRMGGNGHSNAFFGHNSGRINEGFQNCFYGFSSGISNTTGSRNIFIGSAAGANNTNGNLNCLIGHNNTGSTSGNQNTSIGAETVIDGIFTSNVTVIGYGASSNVDNTVRIGNDKIVSIQGEVPFTSSSDIRKKENIYDVPLGINFINKLRPVMYNRKGQDQKAFEMGLIAQELQSTLDEFDLGSSGMLQLDADEYFMIRYNDLLAPMINAIQQLSIQNKILVEEVALLKEQAGLN